MTVHPMNEVAFFYIYAALVLSIFASGHSRDSGLEVGTYFPPLLDQLPASEHA
jgi:hypothetical protein